MDAFWDKAEPIPECGCLIWQGSYIDRDGYGFYYVKENGKWLRYRAHRYAWELVNGPIPKGLEVLHRCDTPSCVNPHHLFVGTQEDNMKDMKKKKRSTIGMKNPQARFTDNEIRTIRNSNKSIDTLAKEYNASYMTVYRIVNNISWIHIL